MRNFRLPIRAAATVLVVGAALIVHLDAKAVSTGAAHGSNGSSISARAPVSAAPRIQIDNFGEISANYFRGAQPQGHDYEDLATAGIKTVIDLTQDGREDEPGLVKQAGMAFYRIPLTTTDRPSEAAIAQFLKIVNDAQNLPVYVHCQGGRHRTGAMTAVYRMTKDGWTADRAYQEMKQYKFEGFPSHPELKGFVYDYFTQLSHAQPASRK